jgi:HSP20 family protein
MNNTTVGRWNPMRELEEFQHHFLNSFTPALAPLPQVALPTDPQGANWQPPADVLENENEYLILIEASGIRKQDVKVTFENNTLTVSGQRKEPEYTKCYQLERAYGTFSRTFPMPSQGSPGSIKAEYEDGVLVVRIGKKEEAKPRQIEVKVTD